MKNKKIIIAFLLCFLMVIYVYVCDIDSIPTHTILFQGESLNIKEIFGISIKSKTEEEKREKTQEKEILTASKINQEEYAVNEEKETFEVKLFNAITVKNIDVNVIKKAKVVPAGNLTGIKLYTNGVLIVGMSEIIGIDNEKYMPYENSGLQEGDMITKIENEEIFDKEEMISIVNNSSGKELKIEYIRDGEIKETNIKPVQINKNEYKLGLWVRDSAAGIGTMTYYEPESSKFAALGHGITDIDTGELLNISNGEIITTKVLSVIKGQEEKPGKIQGSIDGQNKIGNINKNTSFGIYGNTTDISNTNIDLTKTMDVALRSEIELGKATILSSVDGENIEEYNIDIEKIYLNNDYDNKSMLIKVTDEKLINKTGGIIQGMSGSPVIQNGKFVGAVTNVLVSDPKRGYVVFGDMMIKEMNT